jgi:CelD/BcsL family acetyltransferase involved in cellulose biosynthesis
VSTAVTHTEQAGIGREPPAKPVPDNTTVELVGDRARIADEWRYLAKSSQNLFASYEWTDSWWRHYGAAKQALTFLCRRGDGSPIAILPLYVERLGPLRVARFVGDGVADELGPICAPEDAETAGGALRQVLFAGSRRCELLIGRALAAPMGWGRMLRAYMLNHEGSPVVQLAGRSWADFVAQRSKHFRQRVVAGERRLRERHGLHFRLVRREDELPDALESLFALHREMRDGQPSSFLRAEPFHRDFAGRAFDLGWLRLWILEMEGQPAAAALDYRYGDVVSGYQLGLARRWRSKLHARLIVANSIRAASEEGASEYRFGRGAESYKYQFADADPGLESVVAGEGAGHAVAWAMYRGRAVRPAMRRAQGALQRLTRERPSRAEAESDTRR